MAPTRARLRPIFAKENRLRLGARDQGVVSNGDQSDSDSQLGFSASSADPRAFTNCTVFQSRSAMSASKD